MRNTLFFLLLAGGLTFTILYAQGQHNHGGAATAANLDHNQHGTGKGNGCKLTASDLKAMDARIDPMLMGMDSASGDARTNAMAAAIDELVAQRKQMRECMAFMGSEMPNTGGHKHGTGCGRMTGGMRH